jgi:hypothetical protein
MARRPVTSGLVSQVIAAFLFSAVAIIFAIVLHLVAAYVAAAIFLFAGLLGLGAIAYRRRG